MSPWGHTHLVGWFSEGGDIPFMPIGPPGAQIMAERALVTCGYPSILARILARDTPPAAIARTLHDLDGAAASAERKRHRLFMTASQSVYALYIEAQGNPGG